MTRRVFMAADSIRAAEHRDSQGTTTDTSTELPLTPHGLAARTRKKYDPAGTAELAVVMLPAGNVPRFDAPALGPASIEYVNGLDPVAGAPQLTVMMFPARLTDGFVGGVGAMHPTVNEISFDVAVPLALDACTRAK